MRGSLDPLCSASRYGTKSDFAGSSSVMVLKWRTVLLGQERLMSSAERWISEAVIGQRGCAAICLIASCIGAIDNCSVDILTD
jgi:hypothetical protein